MNVDDAAVSSAVGRLNEYEFDRMGVRDALGLVVDAMPSLFHVDGVGILLLDDNLELRHVASSDGAAQVLETVQEQEGRGPCVTAVAADSVVVVEDIETDGRWPDLAAPLLDKGIRGILGVPVHVNGSPVGSLNVYHRDSRGWDESDTRAILAFDRVIERLLAHAVEAARSETIVSQLRHALASRITIDRAVGLLMGLRGIDAPDAFELMRQRARSSRRKVEEVAAEVLSNRALL